jgi:hypothetical protein
VNFIAATPNSGKAQTLASGQLKQSLLLCNNPNFPSSQQLVNLEIGSSSNPGPDQRKRTRGVESSILTAMALKEKRATLSEAKDIRKVPNFYYKFTHLKALDSYLYNEHLKHN